MPVVRIIQPDKVEAGGGVPVVRIIQPDKGCGRGRHADV